MGITGGRHYYDRNPTPVVEYYEGLALASHAWTVRWTYTVPTDRNCFHQFLYGSGLSVIINAGAKARVLWEANIAAGGYERYCYLSHASRDVNYPDLNISLTAHFFLEEGDAIRSQTRHWDGVTHSMYASATLTEYDR